MFPYNALKAQFLLRIKLIVSPTAAAVNLEIDINSNPNKNLSPPSKMIKIIKFRIVRSTKKAVTPLTKNRINSKEAFLFIDFDKCIVQIVYLIVRYVKSIDLQYYLFLITSFSDRIKFK